jgi:hypothetical protein
MFDLLGYSILLGISKNYWNIPEEYEFEEKVHYIIDQIREYVTFETLNQEKNYFPKDFKGTMWFRLYTSNIGRY